MKVLITGIAGGIGSQLARQCLENNFDVIGVDNLITGNLENIKDLIPKINIRTISIFKMKELENQKIDYIFHLAGIADIVDSVSNPRDYFYNNVMGTVAVMEFARATGVKKVIYAASSSCYGMTEQFPTAEDTPINCEYPYAFSKWQGEEVIKHYSKVYKIPYVSLRLFNVYSPYAKPNNSYGAVFKVFLKQFIERKPFTIIGDGMQMRDFIHVKDVCRAFIKAAELDVQNEVINIGASNPCGIYHLSKMIAGEDYPRQYLPWREGEPKVTYADIRKANRLLNWFPLIKIKDGVEEMLENLSNYADAPLWTEETILKKQTEWNKYLCKE